MDGQTDFGVVLEKREEGVVAVLVAMFEDIIEISGRLVGMDDQDEVKRGRSRGRGGHRFMIARG